MAHALLYSAGPYFRDNFSIIIQIWWKFHFVLVHTFTSKFCCLSLISYHFCGLDVIQNGRWDLAKSRNISMINTSRPGGCFKNTYELLNLRALKFSPVNKIYIFQCMGKIFCVEFQRCPLKFHTKYLTHTLKDMIFILRWNFKSS